MDPKEIQQKVIKILAENLNIDPKNITCQSKLVEDLGVDSFSAIEIMFEIEDEFKININEDEIVSIKTVEEIVKNIINKIKIISHYKNLINS
ncbi:MAG: acyl carrier protein [Candidatus Omnitrophica bacterium]|nr:acyl carrier protein [Candidatus Omnitrophota bacterium]